MKRKILLLISFVISSFFSSKGQIAKGSILTGGNISYNKSTVTGDFKQTGFTFAPSFGVAIKDNLILGSTLKYSFWEDEGFTYKTRDYGAGIFLRKYKSLGKDFYLFGQADLRSGYSTSTQSVIVNQVPDVHKVRGHSVGIGVSPGISYALTRRFHLEVMFTDFFSVNYSTSKKESATHQYLIEPKKRAFSANSNLSLNGINSLGVGVRFIINK